MKKILIVKIGAIGDVIMTLPVLKAIRSKYGKDTKITWIVGEISEPIIKEFDIDEVITVKESDLFGKGIIKKIKAIGRIWIKIFSEKYDDVFCFYNDWKYLILTCVVSLKPKRMKDISIIPGRQLSDEYVRLVLGKSEIKKEEKSFCLKFSNVKDTKYKTIVLAPGGAKNILRDDDIRRWPINSYVNLTEKLLEKGYKVIITGSTSDLWVVKYFQGLNVQSYVGKTNIIELANLFSAVDLVITHDSGPMHIAGLVKTNLLALFGPTNPYEKIPLNENAFFIWNAIKYSCCPCYNGRGYVECHKNICLTEIKVDDVLYKVNNILRL